MAHSELLNLLYSYKDGANPQVSRSLRFDSADVTPNPVQYLHQTIPLTTADKNLSLAALGDPKRLLIYNPNNVVLEVEYELKRGSGSYLVNWVDNGGSVLDHIIQVASPWTWETDGAYVGGYANISQAATGGNNGKYLITGISSGVVTLNTTGLTADTGDTVSIDWLSRHKHKLHALNDVGGLLLLSSDVYSSYGINLKVASGTGVAEVFATKY